MKKTVAAILAVIMLFAALAGCTGEEQTTTDDVVIPGSGTGEPDPEPASVMKIGGVGIEEFSVVTAPDANAAVTAAAADFISLIKLAANVELPLLTEAPADGHAIILDVTPSDTDAVKAARAEVREDGYAMLEENGNLYITGAIPKGTSNGMYDFLQDYLGLRFYSGTFTYVRRDGIKDLPSGARKVFNPVFLYRNNYCTEVMMNINNYQARTKGYGTMPGGTGGPHNLGPRSGKGGATSPQPCFSDPEVYETVLESVKKSIKTDAVGVKQVINVCQNDSNAYCKCEQCAAKDEAAGSHMGAQLMFINDIARAVKELYPDLDIDILTLAYQYSEVPPDPEVVKPEDNVIIQLCLITACFTHSFDDPECETNTKTFRNIEGWSKICKKLYIWDYAVCDSSVNHPGPNLNVLWENMQSFKKNNVIGQFQNSFGVETGEFEELRQYLIGRLLWNPDITKEEFYRLWDEFMEDYYGAAAPFIREYMDIINENTRKTGITDWNGHTSIWTDDKVYYTPNINGKKNYETMNKCTELWNKAFECRLDDVTFAHVEKSSLHYREWESKYSEDRTLKRAASAEFKALCDKYTYDYDESLLPAGPTEGFSPEIPSEGLEFREYEDGTLYVSDVGTFHAGMLVIPAKVDGKTVTAVGQSAFSRATCIVEVHVPEGIEYIGTYAFRGCNDMTAVYLPASLKTLGYGALGITKTGHYSTEKLTDVYYAGTTEQWKQLYNAEIGHQNTLAGITVHCADGDVIN